MDPWLNDLGPLTFMVLPRWATPLATLLTWRMSLGNLQTLQGRRFLNCAFTRYRRRKQRMRCYPLFNQNAIGNRRRKQRMRCYPAINRQSATQTAHAHLTAIGVDAGQSNSNGDRRRKQRMRI